MGMSENNRLIARGVALISATFACMLLLSWITVHWDLDRSIVGRFYTPEDGWYLAKRQPWKWLYEYGTLPGLVLTVAALIAWAACLMQSRFRHLQRYFLVIVLTTVIGPGLIVNGFLKNYWGRPRPRQVQDLGGQWEYRHLHQPGIPGRGESFTCGHCSMGFLFCALLVFRRKNAWVAGSGAAFGLMLGGLLGAARVVQGAHFPSDVLWSLAIVLMTAAGLYYLVLQVPQPRAQKQRPMSRPKQHAVTGILITAVVLMLLAFLMHRPFYKEHTVPLILKPDVKQLALKSNRDIEKLNIHYSNDPNARLVLSARGFGWTGAGHRLDTTFHHENGQISVDLLIHKKGFFAELSHELTLYLSKALENRIDVELVEREKQQ
jgi:membrane-associated PAP2 superfamily phosphatase